MHKMQEELSQLRWLKVFSVLIGIFWIVIAGQFKFDASRIPTDKEMRHNDAVCSEMMSFMQTVEDRSDKLGKSYGPRQFFSDIKAIRLKERKLKPDWSLKDMMSSVSRTESFISGLRSRCAGSGEAGLVECSDEYGKYWAEHDNWERENGFVKDPFEDMTVSWFVDVLFWIGHFYWVSLLFLPAIYILRMLRRGGVDEIKNIVGSKPERLALAILLWPLYLLRYPYDILWETWLEIQVRRVGKSAFRKQLTEKEVELIQTMDRRQYRSWKSRQNFQRGVFVAVLGLVLISLGVGVLAASQFDNKAPPEWSSRSIDNDMSFGEMPLILPEGVVFDPVFVSGAVDWEKPVKPVLYVEKIDHIPVYRLVSIH